MPVNFFEGSNAEKVATSLETIAAHLDNVTTANDIIEAVKVVKNEAVSARDEARTAASKYPIIQNGIWHIWNNGSYVSTGIQAQGEAAPASLVAQEITNWMDDNIHSTTVVDKSLTVDGAAADAKVTGDKIAELTEQIESYYKSLNGEKANVNDLAALYVAFDQTEKVIDSINNDITVAEEQIEQAQNELEITKTELSALADQIQSKAETNELAGLYTEVDILNNEFDKFAAETRDKEDNIDQELQSLNDHIATKVEANGLANLAVEQDKTQRDLQELDNRVKMKAEANDVAALSVEIDQKADKYETIDNIIRKANHNDLASLAVNVDLLEKTAVRQSNTIIGIQGIIANVQSDIVGKISKPSEDGNPGQVLMTNGNGGTSWEDPTKPSDSQIGTAVSDWLQDHPEATTTVADGSITEEKLSFELKEKLESNNMAIDAAVLSSALAVSPKPQYPPHLEWEANLYKTYKKKLDLYSTFFTGGDGIGMLFFTDAHNFSPEAYWKQQNDLVYAYSYLKVIFENTPALYIVCGGDMMNCAGFSYAQAIAQGNRINNYLKTHVTERLYLAIGNHDVQWWGADDRTMSNQEKSHVWYDSDVGYYTIKSRICTCYMFDSGMFRMSRSAYGATQALWFAQKLSDEDKPHSYGVIHYIARYIDQGPDWLGNIITQIANAYNRRETIIVEGQTYNFNTATGTFHFILAGHYHKATEETFNNIPVFYSYAFVTDGTIDACYADFDNSLLHMIRFNYGGDGEDRELPIIPNGGYITN